MSLKEFLQYIKHITVEEYNKLSIGEKMVLEAEYELAYGMCIGIPE